MTKWRVFTAAMAVSVLLLTGPAVAGQASMLDASEASGFMGTWVIGMESPRGGTFDQTVTVRDDGGKVADISTPAFESYLPLLRRLLRP